jgi:PAS domain S-box-containing protein
VIWIYDAVEARLDYLSPAFQQTWGIDPQPVLADRDLWRANVHPEDRSTAELALERVLSHGETFTVKYRIVRPDGAIRWIRDTGFPIRAEDGRIVQVGGIAQDVTRDSPLSVYLVDRDFQASARRTALLREAGYRVTSFASERAFLEVAGALTPGCVVVRTEDASAARFELARLLRAQRIVSPVIFETDLSGDVALAIGAMKAGAADVLEAPCDAEVLLSALATALASIGAAAAEGRAAQAARAQIATMSPREREVLEGLLSGGTNKTIARDLGISPRTVEIHRAHVMERLGAQTLPQAVLAATSAGMKPAQRPLEPDLG